MLICYDSSKSLVCIICIISICFHCDNLIVYLSIYPGCEEFLFFSNLLLLEDQGLPEEDFA